MNITFISSSADRLSTVLNLPNFQQLTRIKGISFYFQKEPVPFSNIILIMGYDAKQIKKLKKQNPEAKIGIVDPRPGTSKKIISHADFIVANGWEMKDYYADVIPNIFIYPIYTEIPNFSRIHQKKNKICIGYHGNKVNLQIMQPMISDAINKLGHEIPIEIRAFYNIRNLGKLSKPICESHVKFTPVQYNEEEICDFLAKIDIGIVPNYIPSKITLLNNIKTKFYRGKFNEASNDMLVRYKCTANPGRLFFFMQTGIPIVTGTLPSTGQLIKDEHTGYLASTSGAWYQALKKLATSAEKRNRIAQAMHEEYCERFAIPKLNYQFVDFLKTL
ncbi:hypothetical protein MTBPR1_20137 [Candidatus Terasakiella magnetica]|uniref:Glycosyltransferase n=1 Tax=Candidatus Terasakiella magnetica TaxID=1867952 RepID=A0A1C3RGA5_9PROT|nr:hypothetical protein [Candidatus Terasakiella magnetica]SCA56289.1 hypothetical protein MTBPR1_20137 [Candidatus Terasakiella magnetica]